MITVFVNGEELGVAATTTLADLLSQLDLSSKRIAVELNQEIISRSLFVDVRLNHGDCVEIVHAIGGG